MTTKAKPGEVVLVESLDRESGSIQVKSTGLMDIASQAVAAGNLDAESLERVFGLMERDSANRAKEAFFSAMASFQAECHTIRPNAENKHLRSSYATLDHVVAQTREARARNGFSFAFDSSVEADRITVWCIVRHCAGHSERTSFSVAIAATSKGVNAAQADASASTYARRYAFILAFGLTTGEADDDAQAADVEAITDEQADRIARLVVETNANEAAMLGWLKVDCIEMIPRSRYVDVVHKLEAKLRSKGEK